MDTEPSTKWERNRPTVGCFGGTIIFVVVVVGLAYGVKTAWENRPGLCARNFQFDLDWAVPEQDPVVEKCVGDDPYDSLCFVRRLENGQPRTRAFKWNCSRQHPPAETKTLLFTHVIESGESK